jgi:hypothetical protein
MGDLEKYQAAEERLQSLTDATSTLASQMAELLELRERVRQAQSSNEGDGQQPRYKRVARPWQAIHAKPVDDGSKLLPGTN